MKFDLMVGAMTWQQSATLARQLEDVGFGGMLFTETGQTPWMSIAAAATAAQQLEFARDISMPANNQMLVWRKNTMA